MTDQELVQRLRERGGRWPRAAADRIETLRLERDVMAMAIAYIFEEFGIELPDPTDQRTGNN